MHTHVYYTYKHTHINTPEHTHMGFPVALALKNLLANAGDLGDAGLSPGFPGRSAGGSHGYPLQCSSLENPMDRGAWRLQSVGLQRIRQD